MLRNDLNKNIKVIENHQLRLYKLFYSSLEKRLFSGVSAGVFRYPDNFIFFNLGNTSFLKDAKKIDEYSLFDLASLTKPFTALCILHLIAQNEISLEDKLSRFFQNLKEDIAIWMLLCHVSGLNAYCDLCKICSDLFINNNSDILGICAKEILNSQINCQPLKKQIYSDLGYIVLAHVVESICKKPFNKCVKELVIEPLKLKNTFFFYDIPTNHQIVISVKDSKAPMINDPNARFLNGISGHAGLFGCTKDILKLLQTLFLIYIGELELKGFPKDLLHRFFTPSLPHLGTWALGFDTKSPRCSSAGEHFSLTSVGHLGFTGTSFWLDLKNAIGVSLLTNRTISPLHDSQERMKKLRPQIHSLLWKVGKDI